MVQNKRDKKPAVPSGTLFQVALACSMAHVMKQRQFPRKNITILCVLKEIYAFEIDGSERDPIKQLEF